jgi:uncharacterized protein (DUF1330 family)
MNATHSSTLALLAGVAIGVTGVAALQAQQAKAPPAYAVANIEVTDPAAYAAYAEQVPATVVPYNGRFLARGGKTEVFAGDARKRVAIIAFDSMDDAKKWRESEAYQKLQPMRDKTAKFIQSFAVEGVPEATPAAIGSSTPPAK